MKIFRYITLISLFFSLPLFSDEALGRNSLSIRELIEQVQHAPNEEKRVLMNQLKVQLKKMNTESKKEAMRELKKSFAGKKMQHQRGQQHQHDSSHRYNHQPKFRHLQYGLGKGGAGQGFANGHQGSGHN